MIIYTFFDTICFAMGNSLKDALEKAGFKSTLPKKKTVQKPYPGERKKMHTHHEHRTFCEVCKRVQPDVEMYNHSIAVIKYAKWICVRCADENCINDECRQTAQSELSKRGIFRRFFGRTKRFPNKVKRS